MGTSSITQFSLTHVVPLRGMRGQVIVDLLANYSIDSNDDFEQE